MLKTLKNTFIFFALLIISKNISAQHILHQPVVGAVTDHSAKILFFSDTMIAYSITLHCSEGVMHIEHYTEDATFFCNTILLNQLIPNTQYFYTINVRKDSTTYSGSFKTFASMNDSQKFSFVFGSCTEQSQDFDIFKTMGKDKPDFFIHLGDWLYNKFNTSTNLSDQITLKNLREKYIERFHFLGDFLKNTPVDYIFDDEDGIYDDFSATSYNVIHYEKKYITLDEIPYPDSLKTILKQGLTDFFPSYDEVNSNQSYHQFSYGNADFFVIDNRSTRSANSEIFTTTPKGKLKYNNPKNHELLDSVQLNWLLNGLKNSTAQWKFIVSGVTFNKSYKKVFNIAMRLQNRKIPNYKNGGYIAASLASMWFAYPNTQKKLIDFCRKNQLKNIIFLSGDAHSSAIDDGKNAGFPELMAAGLAQKNSKIAGIIYNNFKLNLWNKGGQGIHNQNYNHAYGKVTVNYNNSVLLEVVDDQGKVIASHQVEDNFIPKQYKLKKQIKINKFYTFGKKIRIGFHQLLGKNKIK